MSEPIAFAMACIACLVLGWVWGWNVRDKQKTKRDDDLRTLTMMLQSHVEHSEAEVVERA